MDDNGLTYLHVGDALEKICDSTMERNVFLSLLPDVAHKESEMIGKAGENGTSNEYDAAILADNVTHDISLSRGLSSISIV